MKLATLLAATCVLASGSAFAADLSVRKAVPAVVAAPAPFSWTGFYVGLNAGYAWSNNSTSYDYLLAGGAADLPEFLAASGFPTGFSNTAGGFIGGGQIGYNYQVGTIVMGLEADIQYVNQKSESGYAVFLSDADGFSTTAIGTQSQINWFGTVRARLGLAMDRALVYATGGLAYGNVETASGILGSGVDFTDGPITAVYGGTSSKTMVGWTIGGGLEYAFTNNLTLRGEYLYYDLGKTSYSMVGGTNTPDNEFLGASVSHKVTGNLVRAGVNWKF